MSGIKPSLTPPPLYLENSKEHRRQLAWAIQKLFGGKGPTPIDAFTLNASSATTTTLTDKRISYYSHLEFMPQTANAAAMKPSLYVPQSTQLNGSAVVNHSANTNSDCTYRVMIWG